MGTGMNWNGFLAVGVGAALGAWLRWGLGHGLNALLPQLPPGTLAANLIGGYLIGLALAWFTFNPGVSPELRLLVVTGFLGGLTTFSTFSAEAFGLLARQQYGWAVAHIGLHLFGSLAATGLGFATLRLLRSSP
jgi:CrcB protein